MTSKTNTPIPATASAPPVGGPPVFELPVLTDQQKLFTIVAALLGMLLAALDQTIVATAGPTIQRELRIENSLYTWITTAYLVTSTMMVPIYGKLSDLFGRKVILLTGIGIFLLGSVLCGVANSGWFLIAARAVQGLGSAALFTSAFAIISDIFPPAVRGKYTGLFGAVFGLSSVVGPLVGGFITDNIGWHWVFFVNMPIGAIAIAFIVIYMPMLKFNRGQPTIDFLGAFWLIIAVVPLLLALSLGKTVVRAGETGFLWGSPEILGMFALAIVGIGAFLFTESRAHDPILDLKLFANRTFAVGNAAAFVMGAGFLAAIVFLPLFLTTVVGLKATYSGLTLTPLTLGLVASNIIVGQLVSRIGRYKPLMLGGAIILMVAFTIMGFTLTVNSSAAEVTFKMILVGIGLGPSIPLFTLAVQNAVPMFKIGSATSAVTFFRSMGSTIGVAILGSVFANTLSSDLASRMEVIQKAAPAAMASRFEQFSSGGGGQSGEEGGSNNGSFDLVKAKAALNKQFDDNKAMIVAALQGDKDALQKVLADPNLPSEQKDKFKDGSVADQVAKGFAVQRELFTKAIRDNDPAAKKALLASPQVPAPMKGLLASPVALPKPVAAQALAGALAGLNQAEAAATSTATTKAVDSVTKALDDGKTQALATLDKIDGAIKESFTYSISQVYRIGVAIIMLAFLIILFLPELPLRKTNSDAPAAVE
jgi:EmrB/QacA subfamily drug resistance transporter